MLEVWALLKVWSEFIIPVIIIVAAVSICFCEYLIKSILWDRKIRWLRNHNFERYLKRVRSVSRGALYEWRNKQTGKRIDELDLAHLKFDTFVKRMKE